MSVVVCFAATSFAIAGESASSPIIVEAEAFESQRHGEVRSWHRLEAGGEVPELDGAGTAKKWTQGDNSPAAGAGGQAFLRILPDTRKTHSDKLIQGENFSPQPGLLAVLDYDVEFPEAGRYYVWVRAFSTGSEDNGLHVGLNGEWPDSGQRMQWCAGKGQWTWNCAQRTTKVHCGVPMQIWLDVAEAGTHTVSFSMREDGFAFDQFLLTTDVTYRPEN